MILRFRWSAVILLSSAACAVVLTAPKPDDMSATAHEDEADRDDQAAHKLESKYQAGANAYHLLPERRGAGDVVEVDPTPFNPTARYLDAAEARLRHAAQHRHAAAELRSFEDRECAQIEPSARAGCPLLGMVSGTREVPRGVRISLDGESDVAEVVSHMRCHQAFAQTRGFSDSAICPLYLKGVRISRPNVLWEIDLLSDDPATAQLLRAAARKMWPPGRRHLPPLARTSVL